MTRLEKLEAFNEMYKEYVYSDTEDVEEWLDNEIEKLKGENIDLERLNVIVKDMVILGNDTPEWKSRVQHSILLIHKILNQNK